MATTIQINSLEALERLIGNDNELEISIRNSVVQNFTKKHLKKLVSSDIMNPIIEKLKKEITEEFKDSSTSKYIGSKFELSKEIMADLKKKLTDQIWENFYIMVNEILERDKIYTTIQDALERAAKTIEGNLKDVELEKRLGYMVDKKIKDKLGFN